MNDPIRRCFAVCKVCPNHHKVYRDGIWYHFCWFDRSYLFLELHWDREYVPDQCTRFMENAVLCQHGNQLE